MGGSRQKIKKLPIKNRANNFNEVECGLTNKGADTEVLRCLRCDIQTNTE